MNDERRQQPDAWFEIGDVISINNADRPAWLDGRWRVVHVGSERIYMQPLQADGAIDADRDAAAVYWLTWAGGAHSEPRFNQ